MVAVVLVPAVVPPPPPPLLLLPPPPHPAIPMTKTRAISPTAALHRNCFSFPPKRTKATLIIAVSATAAGMNQRWMPFGRTPVPGGTLAVVVIVTTVDADWCVESSVTVAGLKLQAAPVGRPV